MNYKSQAHKCIYEQSSNNELLIEELCEQLPTANKSENSAICTNNLLNKLLIVIQIFTQI